MYAEFEAIEYDLAYTLEMDGLGKQQQQIFLMLRIDDGGGVVVGKTTDYDHMNPEGVTQDCVRGSSHFGVFLWT